MNFLFAGYIKRWGQLLLLTLMLALQSCWSIALADQTVNAHRIALIGMDNGLSSNGANNVLRDRDGWIWIATNHGIDLYDGNTVRATFDSEHCPEMPQGTVLQLRQDRLGYIWAKDRASYYRIDPAAGRCLSDTRQYLQSLGIPAAKYHLKIDPRGDLWVMMPQQVYHYDFEAQRLDSLSVPDCQAIAFLRDSRSVVMLQADKTLVHAADYHTPSHLTADTCLRQAAAGITFEVPRLYADHYDNLWLWDGLHLHLYYLPEGSQTWRNLSAEASLPIDVRNVAERRNGQLYLAMGRHGLYCWDRKAQRLSPAPESEFLPEGIIDNVMIDDYDMLWLSYEMQGVAYTIPTNHFGLLSPTSLLAEDKATTGVGRNSVTCVFEDRSGNLWLGTDGGGLTLLPADGQSPWHLDVKQHDVITCLGQDSLGQIWTGTYRDGLYRIDPQLKTVQHYLSSNSQLASDDIWSLACSPEGSLWIGNLNHGIQRWNETRQKVEPPFFAHKSIHRLLSLRDGQLLAGTAHGLCQLPLDSLLEQTGETLPFVVNPNFDEVWIRDIALHPDGSLWLATIQGLYRYRPDADFLTHYGVAEGLRSETVQGVACDSLGQVWATTDYGLVRIDYGQVTCYTTDDGLPFNAFNMRSICCLSDGRIMAGGYEGLVTFHPRDIGTLAEWRHRVFTVAGQPLPFETASTQHSLWMWLMVAAGVLLLIHLLIHHLRKRKTAQKSQPTGVQIDPVTDIPSADALFLERLKQTMEKHVGNADFTVEVFAQEMGISRSKLHKTMLTLTGYAPLEYIRRYRLERARQYLTESQMTVAEIAFQVGFNSPKLFSRYFKEVYSVLPSEVKRTGQPS